MLAKLNTSTQAKEAQAIRQKTCFHCLESFSDYLNIRAEIKGVTRDVCCHGCKAASEFIDQQHLGEFYQRRDKARHSPNTQRISTSNPSNTDWSFLDNKLLAVEYVDQLLDGDRLLKVSVQGVYCASCSWLIDKAISKLSNKVTLSIDVDAKQLTCSVSDPEFSLSVLLQAIEKLGYQPYPLKLNSPSHGSEQIARNEYRDSLKRIAVAGFGMMQVMTYAFALYFGEFQGIEEGYHRFLALVSLLIATAVVFYAGRPFFSNAWNDLKNKHLGMDVPIALAIAGAYFPSVYVTLLDKPGHVYFDSAVMFIFFLSVGRFVEMRARQRLVNPPTALQKLLPPFIWVSRIKGEHTESMQIAPKEVLPADISKLSQQDVVPFDGTIMSGDALVNESLISGESRPVVRSLGDRLYAGSLLVSGDISLSASSKWGDSSLSKIERLLTRARVKGQSDTPVMNGIAQYFVVFVLIATALIGIVWWMVAPHRVFEIVLAMLVASCPCAFALAAPLGAAAASHALRLKGLLLANFNALQIVPKVTAWCFDKTGTMTLGQPKITSVNTMATLDANECMQIASSLQQALKQSDAHVLAYAFNGASDELEVIDIEHHLGNGLSGKINGEQYYLGKMEWVAERLGLGKPFVDNVTKPENRSVVALASDHQYLADFYLEDQLRPQAKSAIESLNSSGNKVVVLSGDHGSIVESITRPFHLDDAQGDLLAGQKLDYVELLQAKGNVVAMVGDGVNDAPVLSQADVSIALSNGSEVAQSRADVVVVNGRLDSLNELRRVAIKTQQITRQNLVWALVYNAIALPLAAAGLLTPWLAALGMSCSSLLVVLNVSRIAKGDKAMSGRALTQPKPQTTLFDRQVRV